MKWLMSATRDILVEVVENRTGMASTRTKWILYCTPLQSTLDYEAKRNFPSTTVADMLGRDAICIFMSLLLWCCFNICYPSSNRAMVCSNIHWMPALPTPLWPPSIKAAFFSSLFRFEIRLKKDMLTDGWARIEQSLGSRLFLRDSCSSSIKIDPGNPFWSPSTVDQAWTTECVPSNEGRSTNVSQVGRIEGRDEPRIWNGDWNKATNNTLGRPTSLHLGGPKPHQADQNLGRQSGRQASTFLLNQYFDPTQELQHTNTGVISDLMAWAETILRSKKDFIMNRHLVYWLSESQIFMLFLLNAVGQKSIVQAALSQ